MFHLLALLALVAPDAAVLDRVLQRFVLADGNVRYGALQADSGDLNEYVAALSRVSPDSHPHFYPSREEKLAYWINAYNALVLSSMSAEYPDSKKRLTGLISRARYFYVRKFLVGGVRRSLDDIESNTIRKFGEPRIHFAIVCASKGCPWLSQRAYTAENLEQQLDTETRRFLNQERNIRLAANGQTLYLSPVFKWFHGDFGDVLAFVRKYRPDIPAGAPLRYLDWDWSLNDAP